jgi:Cdc6-like AAA superfamily ATPase
MADTPDRLPQAERNRRLEALERAFRPAAPIQSEELFAGRARQLIAINDLCQEPGRHGVIFGERGVGKTSLANVSGEYQKRQGNIWLRIGCDSADTFETMWSKAFEALALLPKVRSEQYGQLESIIDIAQDIYLSGNTEVPDAALKGLQVITELVGVVICFDEFDRIQGERTPLLMSDCIKTFSDQQIGATLIIVGVADTIDSLIANHQSIQRAMSQVRMPRMKSEEIEEIINNGYSAADLTVSARVKPWLIEVPQGLPYYAHLIAREAGRHALRKDRDEVVDVDWGAAVHEAALLTDQSVVRTYSEAIASSHKTIYEEVLIACAIAEKDDLGFFTPPDVREPLSRIMGEHYDLPRYSNHLAGLCERGPILERRGKVRRWRYRFLDPLMQPYAMIRGIETGKLRL